MTSLTQTYLSERDAPQFLRTLDKFAVNLVVDVVELVETALYVYCVDGITLLHEILRGLVNVLQPVTVLLQLILDPLGIRHTCQY